jgi:homeobox protein cut-like
MDSFAITEGLLPQDQHEDQPESPMSSKLTEETNKFQRAIAAWRGNYCLVCCPSLTNM